MVCRSSTMLWGAVCLLLTLSAGCRVPPSQRTLSNLRTKKKTAASYDYAARNSSSPRLQAKNYIVAARAYLAEGHFTTAIERLFSAREAYYAGEIAGEINRLLGEAYLDHGKVNLAERYLKKGLSSGTKEERAETLARLVVCARARGDYHLAAELLADLGVPYYYARNGGDSGAISSRVARILDQDVPTPAWESGNGTLKEMLSRSPPPPPSRRPRTAEPSTETRPDWDGSRLHILPRWKWSARPMKSNVELMKQPTRITVHHSGPPKSVWTRSPRETAEFIRGIQRHHQKTRGWADIGYHFIIDRAGTVWQGRPLQFQGAHAGNRQRNAGNIGIVLLGDYGLQKQKLSLQQRKSLLSLLDLLIRQYSISTDQVYTHAEISPKHTECPGPEITVLVHSIRRFLKQQHLLAAGS